MTIKVIYLEFKSANFNLLVSRRNRYSCSSVLNANAAIVSNIFVTFECGVKTNIVLPQYLSDWYKGLKLDARKS